MRVLLVGVSSADLDRLRRLVTADPLMQIVDTLLLESASGTLNRLRHVGSLSDPTKQHWLAVRAANRGGESRQSEATAEGVPYIQPAMRSARADAVLMTPEALTSVQGLRERRPIEELPAEALTARERDVLAYVAEGHGNRGIGRLLGISEHTVKFHLASIYGKLGVGNRTEAVQHALRMGLLEI